MQNEKLKLKIMLDAGAKVPTRAHEADAGLDIYAATYGVVPSGGSCTLPTTRAFTRRFRADMSGCLKARAG